MPAVVVVGATLFVVFVDGYNYSQLEYGSVRQLKREHGFWMHTGLAFVVMGTAVNYQRGWIRQPYGFIAIACGLIVMGMALVALRENWRVVTGRSDNMTLKSLRQHLANGDAQGFGDGNFSWQAKLLMLVWLVAIFVVPMVLSP